MRTISRLAAARGRSAGALAGCGGGGRLESGTLTVYSGREEELVAAALRAVQRSRPGSTVEVRYGDSAELAATIAEEGDNSPADVFFAQDPGSLGAVDGAARGSCRRRRSTASPRASATPSGRWVGTSGRSRVLVYNTDALTEDRAARRRSSTSRTRRGRARSASPRRTPRSRRSSRRCGSPLGDERTRAWLEGLKANDAEDVREEHADRRGGRDAARSSVGLVNHYYLYARQGGAAGRPDREPLLRGRRPGLARQRRGRRRSRRAPTRRTTPSGSSSSCSPTRAQRFYADEAEEAEYPLVAGIARRGRACRRSTTIQGPDVDLTRLRRRARVDARAAPRDRLPRREPRSRQAGAPPRPLAPRGGRRRRARSCCRSPTW